MSDTIVEIYTPAGAKVGTFKNPKIEVLVSDHYEITGTFLEADGRPAERVEFNPQVLPYVAQLSGSGFPHGKLKNVYVQRGRQPVQMVGVGDA